VSLRALGWFGGKGNMLTKLLPLIPTMPVYAEAYGGAASILLNKPPALCEVYNDLDGMLVNFFRVMQRPAQYRRLRYRLESTLYSVAEFARALEIVQHPDGHDEVELAWAFFVGQNQGFGGNDCREATAGNWGRVFVSRREMALITSRWLSGIARLDAVRDRFKRVQIDQKDALEFVQYWDSPNTCLYLDPPYIADTRKSGEYAHEVDDDHHERLVEIILACTGVVVLSGYNHPIYDPLTEAGWRKYEFGVVASTAVSTRKSGLQGEGSALAKVPRIEVVWVNRRGGAQMELL